MKKEGLRTIMNHLERSGSDGLTMAQLVKKSKFAKGTVQYHLEKIIDQGMGKKNSDGRYILDIDQKLANHIFESCLKPINIDDLLKKLFDKCDGPPQLPHDDPLYKFCKANRQYTWKTRELKKKLSE